MHTLSDAPIRPTSDGAHTSSRSARPPRRRRHAVAIVAMVATVGVAGVIGIRALAVDDTTIPHVDASHHFEPIGP